MGLPHPGVPGRSADRVLEGTLPKSAVAGTEERGTSDARASALRAEGGVRGLGSSHWRYCVVSGTISGPIGELPGAGPFLPGNEDLDGGG